MMGESVGSAGERMCWFFGNKYMLFTDREVRIGKTGALGLEYSPWPKEVISL